MKPTAAKGIFVTGTDTGVGKTVVAASLLATLRASGIAAAPMKPVQTGAVKAEAGWRAPDLDLCLAAAGMDVTPDDYRDMTPCCFALPASPHLAAREEGGTVSIPEIVRAFERLAERFEVVVVEGAGGLLVPLSETVTMLDLIRRLCLPVVLVSRTRLGTINHTLLSLRELERAACPAAGVIFCDTTPGEPGLIERDNPRIIAHLSGCATVNKNLGVQGAKPLVGVRGGARLGGVRGEGSPPG